jgi:sugar lactone lactonase YvrE
MRIVLALGIAKLLPDNGLAGSVITVKGTGFDKSPANNRVTINGLAVAVSGATDTTLTITIPDGVTTGPLNVSTGSLSATGPVFRRAGVSTFYSGVLAGGQPRGMVIDSKGNLFTGGNTRINKIMPDGTGTVFAGSDNTGNVDGTGVDAQFYSISGMTIDAQDNLYVSDGFNNNIRKITPDGKVTTIFSGISFSPKFLTIDAAGNLYVGSDYDGIFRIVPGGSEIKKVSNNGINASFACANGYLYISNGDPSVVQSVNIATGENKQLAGVFYQGGYVDGPSGTGKLNGPGSLLYDPVSRLLYVIDAYNYSVRAISPVDGTISTITGAGGSYQSFKSGNKNGTLGVALLSPSQDSPMAVDKAGNIYLMEQNRSQIRKITLR